ncbi:hypothetical protein ACE6H2_018541 [Prunus campanulata]
MAGILNASSNNIQQLIMLKSSTTLGFHISYDEAVAAAATLMKTSSKVVSTTPHANTGNLLFANSTAWNTSAILTSFLGSSNFCVPDSRYVLFAVGDNFLINPSIQAKNLIDSPPIPPCEHKYSIQKPCFDFARSGNGNATIQTIVNAIMANNPDRPIPSSKVKSFGTKDEVDAWLYSNPMHCSGALHFVERNATVISYGIQTNSAPVKARGQYEDPTFKFQIPLQIAAEREIARSLIGVTHFPYSTNFKSKRTVRIVWSLFPPNLLAKALQMLAEATSTPKDIGISWSTRTKCGPNDDHDCMTIGGICSCMGSVPPQEHFTPDDEDVLAEENIVKQQAKEGTVDPNIAVQIRGLVKTYPGTTTIGCCKCRRTSPYHALKNFFAELQDREREYGIVDIQLGLATLEEVFLNIARQAELEAATAEGRLIPVGARFVGIPRTECAEYPSGVMVKVFREQDESGALCISGHSPETPIPPNVEATPSDKGFIWPIRPFPTGSWNSDSSWPTQ